MEDAKLVIVDTSVILKWFFWESDRKNALKIRDEFIAGQINLGMPTHCLVEVGNILGIKQPENAVLIISEIQMMQIEEYHLSLELVQQAIKIMRKFPKTSFYDAMYHAIAIENRGVFVTADKKYYDSTKSLKHMKLLSEY